MEEENKSTVANGLRLAIAIDWEDASEEGLKWLQKGAALIPRGIPEFNLLLANAMTNTTPMLINRSEFKSAIETLHESIELYKSIPSADKRGWVTALFLLAWAAMDSGYARSRSW